jgi:hypothetical protein
LTPGKKLRLAAWGLSPIGKILGAVEKKLYNRKNDLIPHPVFFIIGVPRSGTTIVYQCLTQTLNVCYPNQICTLLPQAPIIALKLANFFSKNPHNCFESILGHSIGRGLLGPDEWETFFDSYIFPLNNEIRYKRLQNIAYHQNQPLMVKALNASLNIIDIYRAIPNAKFIWVKRDSTEVARSIIRAKRVEKTKREDLWYIKPDSIQSKHFSSEIEQVIAQIKEIKNTISKDLKKIPKQSFIMIEYQNFCYAPEKHVRKISTHFCELSIRNSSALPHLRRSLSTPLGEKEEESLFKAFTNRLPDSHPKQS